MARMYIRHEPTTVKVDPGASWVDNTDGMRGVARRSFYLDAVDSPPDDVVYICFVHEGRCWAARSREFFSQGKRVNFACVEFDDGRSSKLMLLKDTLLG